MENYHQSPQKDENQQSSTTPNQYISQDQHELNRQTGSMQQDDRHDRTVDNDTRYGADQRMTDSLGGNTDRERNFEERSQRPNQYNSAGDDPNDMEEEDDMDDDTALGLDEMDDDVEEDDDRDSSATRQNLGSQRGGEFDNSQSTEL